LQRLAGAEPGRSCFPRLCFLNITTCKNGDLLDPVNACIPLPAFPARKSELTALYPPPLSSLSRRRV
jgi:hypothetical protein